MNKKIVVGLLLLPLTLSAFSGCSSQKVTEQSDNQTSGAKEYSVAMITDSGDITDESYNQTTYEAARDFCEENSIDFKYYKPIKGSTDAREASITQAIEEGYNVIVMPGYMFAESLVDMAPAYPDVDFIALDITESDLLAVTVGDTYDYEPENWDLSDYLCTDNIYCASYREEISGFMAGYAAVKMGYRSLAFFGGKEIPAVMHYGYGYLQGADQAAKELGVDVTMQYQYTDTFLTNCPENVAAAQNMVDNGADVMFCCGGSIYKDVLQPVAASSTCMAIGVDVDQASNINEELGRDITVTSAMKGLRATVMDALNGIILEDRASDYLGQLKVLGMVSENPEENYSQLAPSTVYNNGFGKEDYQALVTAIYNGEIQVDDSLDAMPQTERVTVTTYETVVTGK